jgi:ketosteroid isomerase-like protein
MSEHEVEILRQGLLSVDPTGRFRFDILDAEVQDALLSLWDDDVEFEEDPRFPEAGIYRGRAAVAAYFDSFKSLFETFDFEVEDIIDAGDDRVLMLVRESVRGLGSGVDTQMRSGWIMRIRDGKVVRVRPYVEREEALQAAGLRE